MIVKNQIEKPFGPSGTTSGIVIFLAGLVYTYYSIIGLLMVIAGAFIGFTNVSTYLDIEQRRIKFSNVLFGIFPAGKWIEINNGMKLGLKKSHRGFRTYSRGMRTNDFIAKDIRVILYGSNKKKLGPIKKYKTAKLANEGLEELCKTLNLEVVAGRIKD